MNRKGVSRLLAILVTTGLAATSLATAVAASADEGGPQVVGAVEVMSARLDAKTRVPTVVVNVQCVGTGEFVRMRATLEQVRGGTAGAASRQVAAGTCTVGQVLTLNVVFAPQAGSFGPGDARLTGFVEAYEQCCTIADLDQLPATSIKLRPRP